MLRAHAVGLEWTLGRGRSLAEWDFIRAGLVVVGVGLGILEGVLEGVVGGLMVGCGMWDVAREFLAVGVYPGFRYLKLAC